jgi:hypothetical protein
LPARARATRPSIPAVQVVEIDADPDPVETDPERTRPSRRRAMEAAHAAAARKPLLLLAGASLAIGACSVVAVSMAHALADRRGADAPAQPATLAAQIAPPATPPRPPPPDPPADPAPAAIANEQSAPAALPIDVGELQPPASAAGHRIFVDGRTVSEGTDPIRVACGAHVIRVGSAGRTQRIQVPCGEVLALTR